MLALDLGLGFRDWGQGFRDEGLGFRSQSAPVRVAGLGVGLEI